MASKWKAGTFTAALLTVASIVAFCCPEGRPRLGYDHQTQTCLTDDTADGAPRLNRGCSLPYAPAPRRRRFCYSSRHTRL
jgi:hypothetical protein